MRLAALIVCLVTMTWTDCVQVVGANTSKVHVREGSDVILPCSLSSEQNLEGEVFNWRNGRSKVFLYDAGHHDNNTDMGQDEPFKGRVSHFPEQLKHGNASIKIHKVRVTDSGTYTCVLPHLSPGQKQRVELVVGAALEPYLQVIHQTNHRALLRCEVTGVAPNLQVAWQDGAGNQLTAAETRSTERGGGLNVTVQTSITESGCYRCVVTQEDIGHQVSGETCLHIGEEQPRKTNGLTCSYGWSIVSSFTGAFLGCLALTLMSYSRRWLKRCFCGKHEPDVQSSQHQQALMKGHHEEEHLDQQQQGGT